MRSKKKHRRIKAGPTAEYRFGGGVVVRCYVDWPPRSKIRKAARRWRRETARRGERVTLSSSGKTYESGRCPECGCVTPGSGELLCDPPDAGEYERSYCPPCLQKINKGESKDESIGCITGV